jgi:TRAP-type C4-dicarboxylate transport system substrate-binding protein
MKGLCFAGFLCALAVAEPAAAEPLTYKLTYPGAPQGLLNQHGFVPWAEQVSKDSDGTLEVKVFAGPSLANYGNVLDRVTNGVAEIGYAIYGPLSSEFPKTLVVTLPFETRTGEEAAHAIWRLYEKGSIASEYQKIRLLAINVFPNVSLHSRAKPIKTIEDMKGLKVSAEGRFLSRSLDALGAAPIPMPVTELYQSLQRGTIDAAAIAFPAIQTFKLDEVSKYHLDVALANDAGMMFVNKDAYAKLPDKTKTLIDRTTGQAMVTKLIGVVAEMTDGAHRIVKNRSDQVVSGLDDAELARWRDKVAPTVEDWTRSTPDGAAVLAAFRTEIKNIRAGK